MIHIEISDTDKKGSLSNRIGGDFERHIHFGECAFCLLMN